MFKQFKAAVEAAQPDEKTKRLANWLTAGMLLLGAGLFVYGLTLPTEPRAWATQTIEQPAPAASGYRGELDYSDAKTLGALAVSQGFPCTDISGSSLSRTNVVIYCDRDAYVYEFRRHADDVWTVRAI